MTLGVSDKTVQTLSLLDLFAAVTWCNTPAQNRTATGVHTCVDQLTRLNRCQPVTLPPPFGTEVHDTKKKKIN